MKEQAAPWDVHGIEAIHKRTKELIEQDDGISKKNKELISAYDDFLRRRQLKTTSRNKVALILKRLGQYSEKYLKGKCFKDFKREDAEKLVDKVLDSDEIGESWKVETLKHFKCFMRHTFKADEYPPCVKWIKPKPVKVAKVSPNDFVSVDELKLIANNTRSLRDRVLLLVLWESGMRIGSLLTLCRGDCIKDDEGIGYYLNMGEGTVSKTGLWQVPVFYFANELSEWLAEHPAKNNPKAPLFCLQHEPTQPIGYRAILKMWHKALKQAGITGKRRNVHSLRHSSISWFAASGLLTNVELCQKYWGSAHSNQLNRYAHVDLRKTMRKLRGDTAEAEKPRMKTCLTCGRVNDPFCQVCSGCGSTLSPQDDKARRVWHEGLGKQLERMIMTGDQNFMDTLKNLRQPQPQANGV